MILSPGFFMATAPSTDFFEYCPGLLFIADARGTLTHRSKALSERFGARLEGDATLASLAASDDGETVGEFLRALATSEEPATCTLRIPDGGSGYTQVRCQARRAPDGSLHGVLELGLATDEESRQSRIERKLLGSIMGALEIVAWAVDTDGIFVFHEGKALATAGLTTGQFLGMNIFELYPPELVDPIRAALAGTPSTYKSEAHGVHWETWNLPLKNPDGGIEYCVGLTMDITPAIQTETELRRQLETIQVQQRAIHELSAPLIEVWDHVLTVPLVGTIDTQRANELIERLLVQVSRAGARFAILDLTGAEALDTATASHILQLLDSLRLLGVEGMITGISPTVAQTMVGLEINLGRITTRRTLRDGLRYCMSKL
jgi:rsbT co-antagonist protein RsbR